MRIIIIAALSLLSVCANAFDPDGFMVRSNGSVGERGVAEYTNIWWQWANSMNDYESPVIDTVGEKCHIGQFGQVWFLAGGYGSSRISRKCSVPEGKYIFFPVINMAYWPRNPGGMTCSEAMEKAALNNDKLLEISVELDGNFVSEPFKLRLKSPECFDLFALKKENSAKVYPTATDGFWVMLKPLASGHHKLTFRAKYNRPGSPYGTMAQDIEYDLTIGKP